MSIIEVDASTKEPREFKGRKKWGVKPVGGADWLNLYCDFRPQKGQKFDVSIKETPGKDGRVFRDAEIIGPAQITPQVAPSAPPPAPPPSLEAIAKEAFNQLKPNSYAEAPRNSKISWDDWALVIRTTWDIVLDTGMPPAEGVALLNTTLIAYSNGKLETPVFIAPVSDGDAEVKDDDIPW